MENNAITLDPLSHAAQELQNVRPLPRLSIDAFCETATGASVLRAVAEDRRMNRTHWQVKTGGIASALETYHVASTPNLIILESEASPQGLLEQIAQLAEVCDSGTKVLIIGGCNEVWFYRELLRNGVSDYIVAPISIGDVINVMASLFADPDTAPLGQTLAFIGAKGGTGSSTLAHNIGWSIANQFKSDVLMADLDLAFGTLNINFDQDPALGIAEAVYSPERIDEVFLDRLLAQAGDHLSLLTAPSTLERTYDFETHDFAALIDLAQRSSPAIVLDLPHSWNNWVRNTLINADEVIITATPDLASLRNTKNLLDTLAQLRPNDNSARLILNQVGVAKRPEISVADFCAPLNIKPLAVIAHEPHLFGTAANNAKMLGESDAKHPISATVSEIAQALTGRSQTTTQKPRGLSGLLRKLKRKEQA